MKTKLAIPALLAALAVSACASTPGSIAPVSMGNAFAAMDCRQAQNELVAERQKLDGLSARQRGAVAADAIGVFLVLVPAGSLTGNDVEGEIAASKGKVLAYEARLKSCGA